MHELVCPGLPGHWINGWLAAVGATVLDPRLQLRWTEGSAKTAVLASSDGLPVDVLASAWPNESALRDLPLAEVWRGAAPLSPGGRRVSAESFAQRARAARSHASSWTLSSTMTDLAVARDGLVGHAPFDPAGPGKVKWLHHRLVKLCGHIPSSRIGAFIAESLAGEAVRVKDNGLGFDHARLGSAADTSGNLVDPVIEVLAFFGLALLPVRGLGIDGRISRLRPPDAIQRGWSRTGDNRAFHWPAWHAPLGAPAIDALLDAWQPDRRASWRPYGVHAGWRTVAYTPRSAADPTRGFASEQL